MGKRNPNGYGCVTCLKGNRSKPWVVKVTVYDEDGKGRQVPIGYEESEERAKILLAQYNNNPWDIEREKVTLAVLYKRWSEIKLPKLGAANQKSMKAAYRHCSKYYGMTYRKLRSFHMQDCIDNCGRGYATQWAIKNLFWHLDRFAFELDIIEKQYSQITTAPPAPPTSKDRFSEDEIKKLWTKAEEPWVDSVLIYLYTGFRLNELLGLKSEQVDMNQQIIRGGSKTAAGKDRIVPIHARIKPLIQKRLDEGNEYLLAYNGKKVSSANYYLMWNEIMEKLGFDKTPHECRHTLRSRLDSAGANKKCIDLIIGHKSSDIGERTYTHKTIQELKEAMAKIS